MLYFLPTSTANENDHWTNVWISTVAIVIAACQTSPAWGQGDGTQKNKEPLPKAAIQKHLATVEAFTAEYCIECHSGTDAEHGYDLETQSFDAVNFLDADASTKHWELALRRADTRQMPPPGATRPSEDEYRQLTQSPDIDLGRSQRSVPKAGQHQHAAATHSHRIPKLDPRPSGRRCECG